SGYWNEKLYPEGFILIEPRVAEKAIALIINDEFEAAEELARLLLVLERGIEAEIPPEGTGRCPATSATIGMMIELAYLESKNYHCSLRDWRETLKRLNVGTLERSEGKVEGSGKRDRRDQQTLERPRVSKRKSKDRKGSSSRPGPVGGPGSSGSSILRTFGSAGAGDLEA